MSHLSSLVIRGGKIVDGNGHAPWVGDILVVDGKVAQIGQVAAKGGREIGSAGENRNPRLCRQAPGFEADIHFIDYEALKIEPMKVQFDLPSGGRRLMQESCGYVATILSGDVVTEDGVPTGALPGRLVRGAQDAQPGRLAAE